MTHRSSFGYFKTSPEIIRLAVMMDIRFLLSLRNVEYVIPGPTVDIRRALRRKGRWVSTTSADATAA